MPLTRREFTALSSAAVALTVLGCDSHAEPSAGATAPHGGNKKKIKLATEPFTIGGVDKYKKPAVSSEYHDDKGIFVISDGKTLVALSSICTHRGCATDYEAKAHDFKCPCHKSVFAETGGNVSGKANRPLERCAVKLVTDKDGHEVIEVDPTRRFLKDKNEWGNAEASLQLG